jgi:hypothetical protein
VGEIISLQVDPFHHLNQQRNTHAMARAALDKLNRIDASIEKAQFAESNIDETGHTLDRPIIRRVANYGQFLRLVEHMYQRLDMMVAMGKPLRMPIATVKRMMDPFMNAQLFVSNDVAVEFFKDVLTTSRYIFVIRDKTNGSEISKTEINIE